VRPCDNSLVSGGVDDPLPAEDESACDGVDWSSEFETPRISRHCLTVVANSGPGVQFRKAGTLDVAVLRG
jgi:hypothetical protein